MEVENKSSDLNARISPNGAYTTHIVELDNGSAYKVVNMLCSHPLCTLGENEPVLSVDNLIASVRMSHGDDQFADKKGSNADAIAHGIKEHLVVTDGTRVIDDGLSGSAVPVMVRYHSCLESAHQHCSSGCGANTSGAYNARFCETLQPHVPLYSGILPMQPPASDSSLLLEDTDFTGESVISCCSTPYSCVHPVETARVGGGHPAYASHFPKNAAGVSLQSPYLPVWPDTRRDIELALEKQLRDARGPGSLVHDRKLLARQFRVAGRRGLLPASCCEDVTMTAHGVYSGQQLVFTADGSPTQWFPALCSKVWSRFTQWDFDMFELDLVSLHKPLSSVLLYIAHKEGWFQRLGIDKLKFAMFVTMLESGYVENPYHNRTHAADVVHGLYSLICMYRNGRTSSDFCSSIYGNEELKEKYSQTEWYQSLPQEYKDAVTQCQGTSCLQKPGLTLCDQVDDIDIFSLIQAASLHDNKHPGCTNVHLLVEQNALAGRFRGLGIQEHWHTLESFKLLRFPLCDILSCFNDEQRERIQESLIVLITGTDMQQHGLIHSEAKGLLDRVKNGSYSQTAADKRVLQRSVVHYADIANPCKPQVLCAQWAERVWEEWHVQREKEAVRMGLHVHASVLMREFTVLPQSQVGFLKFIALPYASTVTELLHVPSVLDIAASNQVFWEKAMAAFSSEHAPTIAALGREMDQVYLTKAGFIGDAQQELSQARRAHRDGLSFQSKLDPAKFQAVLSEQEKELYGKVNVELEFGSSSRENK